MNNKQHKFLVDTLPNIDIDELSEKSAADLILKILIEDYNRMDCLDYIGRIKAKRSSGGTMAVRIGGTAKMGKTLTRLKRIMNNRYISIYSANYTLRNTAIYYLYNASVILGIWDNIRDIIINNIKDKFSLDENDLKLLKFYVNVLEGKSKTFKLNSELLIISCGNNKDNEQVARHNEKTEKAYNVLLK